MPSNNLFLAFKKFALDWNVSILVVFETVLPDCPAKEKQNTTSKQILFVRLFERKQLNEDVSKTTQACSRLGLFKKLLEKCTEVVKWVEISWQMPTAGANEANRKRKKS